MKHLYGLYAALAFLFVVLGKAEEESVAGVEDNNGNDENEDGLQFGGKGHHSNENMINKVFGNAENFIVFMVVTTIYVTLVVLLSACYIKKYCLINRSSSDNKDGSNNNKEGNIQNGYKKIKIAGKTAYKNPKLYLASPELSPVIDGSEDWDEEALSLKNNAFGGFKLDDNGIYNGYGGVTVTDD